ncbi:hypothetical protein ACOI1H_08370 [Loktanella sp. DJP18]
MVRWSFVALAQAQRRRRNRPMTRPSGPALWTAQRPLWLKQR